MRIFITPITQVMLLLVLVVPVNAHQGATGIVKERMMLMEGIGKDMKQLRRMAKGQIPFDAQLFHDNVRSIHADSQQILPLFPEGSLQHPTEARPSIWKKWDQFEREANSLTETSAILEQTLPSNNRKLINAQLKKVSKTCLGCHKRFRKKKK